ncbi:cupin domain-containing protein [Oceanimonas marisflavi]|uniref:cupin domain-containing protein n=1 Tax=Oceanimonas marisflavi TaxID=2059724 RepID=UPI000D3173EF|nr:cupin domain-containing protein [Oceanimonas marisflavi]
MVKHLLVCSSVLWLLAGTAAMAEKVTDEPALAYTFKDPRLEWGPCPSFLPAGCEVAVLHGDPAKPNVDIFFKVPGGSYIPSHTHTSAERMVLVSGSLEVTYEGQSPVRLEPGSYAYGPASRPHQAVCADGDPCVLFIAFEAPVDAIPLEAAAE